jgi:hypothetical protein
MWRRPGNAPCKLEQELLRRLSMEWYWWHINFYLKLSSTIYISPSSNNQIVFMLKLSLKNVVSEISYFKTFNSPI